MLFSYYISNQIFNFSVKIKFINDISQKLKIIN